MSQLLCWLGLHAWRETARRYEITTRNGPQWDEEIVLEHCAWCRKRREQTVSAWDQMV